MVKVSHRHYVLLLLLASAVIPWSLAATAEPPCSSSAGTVSTRFTNTPCSGTTARALLIEAASAQPDHSSSRSSSLGSADTAVASAGPEIKVKSGHKPLSPVSKNDVAVFVLAGFVLFIAAGAGATPALLVQPSKPSKVQLFSQLSTHSSRCACINCCLIASCYHTSNLASQGKQSAVLQACLLLLARSKAVAPVLLRTCSAVNTQPNSSATSSPENTPVLAENHHAHHVNKQKHCYIVLLTSVGDMMLILNEASQQPATAAVAWPCRHGRRPSACAYLPHPRRLQPTATVPDTVQLKYSKRSHRPAAAALQAWVGAQCSCPSTSPWAPSASKQQ